MARFVKIGQDLVNLDFVSRVAFMENQSGISDRILIEVGSTTVVIDSAIGGRNRMNLVRDKLMAALTPEPWDEPQSGPLPIAA